MDSSQGDVKMRMDAAACSRCACSACACTNSRRSSCRSRRCSSPMSGAYMPRIAAPPGASSSVSAVHYGRRQARNLSTCTSTTEHVNTDAV
jgi:hypothetical protein